MEHLNIKGKIISEASTNLTQLKDKSGLLGFLAAGNAGSSEVYLKVFDQTEQPTIGVTESTFTFIIPGNTAGAGSNLGIPFGGIDFGYAIWIALTAGMGDDDNTPVNAGEVVINYGCK